MAELQQQKGKRRRLLIDMTAMVDVAFLLLTFFVLTAAMSKPSALEANHPAAGPGPKVACEKIVTLFLVEENNVMIQIGCNNETEVLNSGIEVRNFILNQLAINPEMIFSIKPTEKAIYKNLVDILDEMKITGAKKYLFSEMTEDEKVFLAGQQN